ncbi:aldose 1-epimerase family protein [Dellaglioa sp. P0083]|uniref:aldose 1-epimerase family protein n=1 Tax=Dellaglioa kimchii TaxID=3344667 RepID=UPI0038D445FC
MTVELKNDFITVKIAEQGAELISITGNDTSIEYIWQADKQYWGRHAPVLFPFVGRLKNDEYAYDHKTYKMGQHGFARDMLFTAASKSKTSVVLELGSSPETISKYPFNFRLRLHYILNNHQIKVIYDVYNPDENPLLFSIGGHPAFNVPLKNAYLNLENYQIEVAPNVERRQIPLVGPFSDIENAKSVKFNEPIKLSRETFKNDALIYELKQLETTVLLSTPEDDHGVSVTLNGADYVGIWSKYPENSPFVCIEPWWGVADNIKSTGNLSDKSNIYTLEKNKSFEGSYEITVF